MNPKTFHMISLGCAKNTVDSDSMAQLLVRDGYQPVNSARRASVLVVNTCGFIGTAREESYSELSRLAEAKRPGGYPAWTEFSVPGAGWILWV
jgi:ribosomal protein S12 methylthiotransferase